MTSPMTIPTTSPTTSPTPSPTIRIHPADNVVIARRQLLGGAVLAEEGGLVVTGLVPPGHKIATRPLVAGDAAKLYATNINYGSLYYAAVRL